MADLIKTCTKCGEEKLRTADYFRRDKQKKDGLLPRCKECEKSRYYENRDINLKLMKNYREANREKHLRNLKSWRDANVDKRKADKRAWNEANIKKILKYKIAYVKNRKKDDPLFRLIMNLRQRIRTALHGKTKSASTMELLGCSIEHFQSHIESQFRPGMTWDNYGPVWHLDHRKPFAVFENLLDPEQQREVCHYTNLQPLFAEENLLKNSKWTEEERSG